MTDSQAATLAALTRSRVALTLREVAANAGQNTDTARRNLKALVERGDVSATGEYYAAVTRKPLREAG